MKLPVFFVLCLLAGSASALTKEDPPPPPPPSCGFQKNECPVPYFEASFRTKSCTSSFKSYCLHPEEEPAPVTVNCVPVGRGYSCDVSPVGMDISYAWSGSGAISLSAGSSGPWTKTISCTRWGVSYGRLTVMLTTPYGQMAGEVVHLECGTNPL